MKSSELRSLEDVQLMGRIAAGESDAFATLFDRHSPVVLGMLIRMLGRREIAEEILQETFLQAWDQADRYSPRRASPKGWLLLIARSRALDRVRSGSSRSRREEVAHHESVGAGVDEAVGTRRLEAQERSNRVTAALRSLPAEQRECIELAFFEGLTHSLVAERTGQPLGTVKSRILLGMTKLKQALVT